jgi:hypothetical protein
MVIGFIAFLQVVTTNNYKSIADLHNLESLHTNLLSLSAVALTDLSRRNYVARATSSAANGQINSQSDT